MLHKEEKIKIEKRPYSITVFVNEESVETLAFDDNDADFDLLKKLDEEFEIKAIISPGGFVNYEIETDAEGFFKIHKNYKSAILMSAA